MSQGGEQSQQRRHSSRNIGSPNTRPLYFQENERELYASQTDAYANAYANVYDDEVLLDDVPRQKPNAMRHDTTRNLPAQRISSVSSQRLLRPPRTPKPAAAPIPYRRQQRMTRDFPSRQQFRAANSQHLSPSASEHTRQKVHWLLPLGVGMVAMLVIWIFGSLAVSWGTQLYDSVVYGYPRTYQTNAVVGHGGDSPAHPSHFIAMNLNHQAVIIELMAGNPSKSVSYVVPYYLVGNNSELAPITLEFRDVTGDGKPDMIIHIHWHPQDQTFVFVNNGTRFRPPSSSDKIHI